MYTYSFVCQGPNIAAKDGHPVQTSQPARTHLRRIAFGLGPFVLYILIFPVMYASFGDPWAAVVLVPIGFAGWCLGWPVGVAAGLASAPLNAWLINLTGGDGWESVRNAIAAVAVACAAGPAIGWVGTLYRQNRRRAEQLAREQENLQEEIRERKQIEATLLHLACHDSLTDLLNRGRFEAELAEILSACRQGRARGALIFLDVDRFEEINDSLGHKAGDGVLRRLAHLLRTETPDGAVLARVGGDEFVVLLQGTGLNEAERIASRILEAIARGRIDDPWVAFRVTASAGVTLFPDHGTTTEAVLSCADLATARAKEMGGNRSVVYRPEARWRAKVTTRREWEYRIRAALEQDRFTVHCQPIRHLRTHRVSHYELLVRMIGANGVLIPPGDFLSVAEQFGLIHQIDRFVVGQAIRLLSHQGQAGHDLTLGVNLSGKTFADEGLLPMIQGALAANRINPNSLVLEITETAAISDIDRASHFIDSLRRVGCRFALDDFGMGFSSFYNLKHLPVDYLKIDGSFIRNLTTDRVDQHLVKAMVDLAKGLGKLTVAEFVDNAETVELLRDWGVDYAQGFFIGRPLPVGEVGLLAAPSRN